MSKTLIIEKYDYGFRFFVDEEETSWFIKDSNRNPKAYVLIEEKDREMVDATDDFYEDLGVDNLCGLYKLLLTHPSEALEMLIGEKMQIDKIIIENYSEKFREDFETCDF